MSIVPPRLSPWTENGLFSHGTVFQHLSALLVEWWSQTGSNRRHPACKAGALPAELWPRQVPTAAGRRPDDGCPAHSRLGHVKSRLIATIMVGLGRFELPTSRLSSARSNQLSYRPGSPDLAQYGRSCVPCEERETKAAASRIVQRIS